MPTFMSKPWGEVRNSLHPLSRNRMAYLFYAAASRMFRVSTIRMTSSNPATNAFSCADTSTSRSVTSKARTSLPFPMKRSRLVAVQTPSGRTQSIFRKMQSTSLRVSWMVSPIVSEPAVWRYPASCTDLPDYLSHAFAVPEYQLVQATRRRRGEINAEVLSIPETDSHPPLHRHSGLPTWPRTDTTLERPRSESWVPLMHRDTPQGLKSECLAQT